MPSRSRISILLSVAATIVVLTLVGGCGERSPLEPRSSEQASDTRVEAPEAASQNQGQGPGNNNGRGGPNAGGGDDGDDGDGGDGNDGGDGDGEGDGDGSGDDPDGEEIVVGSIEPDSAAQGTTEEVVVLGEGFEDDAELAWELGGEPTDQIVTLSSRVVNPKRIEATIAVAAEAPEALFDVVVRTPRGRRGVGIEMFEVVEGNIPLAFTLEEETSDGAAAAITGDGRADGWYRDGECGVSAIVNVDGSGPDSPGDALLRTDWRKPHPRERDACDGRDSRRYNVRLDDPVGGAEPRPERDAGFANVNDVEWVRFDPILSGAAFNAGGCNLRFGDAFPGTDPVRVSPVHQGGRLIGWEVESTGDHVGMCLELGTDPPAGDLFRVPFRIIIRTQAGEAAFPF